MKKIALITGSSGLIGSELVREFLSEGFSVIGLDIKAHPDLKHPDFNFMKCDLSKEAQIKQALKSLKRLDVLINNGAKAAPRAPSIEKMTVKMWEDGLRSHLTNYFMMTKYSLPLLRKSKGTIINISSTRHLMSEPHTEIYTTSKGGIDALTRSLSISLAHEVRVNSISPGWIADPKEKMKKTDHDQHPVGRVGRPSDISRAALWLASDSAGFVTGQDFIIDGGMTVKMIYN